MRPKIYTPGVFARKLSIIPDKEKFILLYPDTSNATLAAMFSCSISTLRVHARLHGVEKSASYMENHAEKFEEGHVPANKGMKGIHNSPTTEFKPGHILANHQPIGTISVRSNYIRNHHYTYIKIAEPNTWQPYHYYLWGKENGPVPKGKKLVFKNGDSLKVELSNLELITAQEHLDRNKNYPKMSETMTKLWKKEKQRVKYGLPQQTGLRVNKLNCYQ